MCDAIGVGQLRGDARNYIERVAAGDSFNVLRRGRPVARLQAAHDRHHRLIPVSLDEFRRRTGRLLDRIEAGETITIELRGETMAAMRPWTDAPRPKPARMSPPRPRPTGR
ncbi:type II toxin-antitoxin system Phd/YefM family antitoxin [Mycolicibacterium hippocampi]|uniref:Antitoxin n=1 Tax=Mycolicibacterium hippocampi TaxID=659824 RepID=A0A7I9ZKJ9_9MYCO|nr:hypothetical protein [Mycolicibacterium hippocampi]GFH01336.1 hypothetical protein MHIP_18190 [Mycolicibacterium hippocampi]